MFDVLDDNGWNDSQRELINAFVAKHKQAWLVHLNELDKPITKVDGFVHNFYGSAVIPEYNETLNQMIIDRLSAPYTGTANDSKLLEPIMKKISELGGKYLFWV